MSTEVVEPPAPPAADTAPIASFSFENIRVGTGSQVISPSNPAPGAIREEPKPAEEIPSEQPNPEEIVKPEPPVEVDKEFEEELKKRSSKTRENFDRLSTEARKAREERDKFQKEVEAAQKRIQEYEEKLKNPAVPEDYQKQLQERETKLAELQNELRFVNLERDPEFIARFSTDHLTGAMKDLAVSTGIDEAAFQRALKTGNEDQLSDIRDSLQPAQQRRWDAALLQIEQTELQRQQALSQRDRTWQEIQQSREQQWQQQAQLQTKENISLAEQTFAKMVEITPLFQEDEESREQARRVSIAMAGGEGAEKFTKETILQWGMANVALVRTNNLKDEVIAGHAEKLTEYETEIAELKKTLAERNEFIEKRHGGLPSNTPSSAASKPTADDDKPAWERIVIRR